MMSELKNKIMAKIRLLKNKEINGIPYKAGDVVEMDYQEAKNINNLGFMEPALEFIDLVKIRVHKNTIYNLQKHKAGSIIETTRDFADSLLNIQSNEVYASLVTDEEVESESQKSNFKKIEQPLNDSKNGLDKLVNKDKELQKKLKKRYE